MHTILVHIHGFQRVIYPFSHLLIGNAEVFERKSHVLLNDRRDYLVVRILKNHSCALSEVKKAAVVFGVNAVNRDRSLRGKEYRVYMFGKG